MSLAWHIAALPKMKRFPALKKMQVPLGGRHRRQTPGQMLAIAKQWTLMMGGTIKKQKADS